MPYSRRLYILYLLAFTAIPTVIIGLIINGFIRAIYLPEKVIQQSESLALDASKTAESRLKESGWLTETVVSPGV